MTFHFLLCRSPSLLRRLNFSLWIYTYLYTSSSPFHYRSSYFLLLREKPLSLFPTSLLLMCYVDKTRQVMST